MASQVNLADLAMQVKKDPDSVAKRRTVTLVEGTIAAGAGVSADDDARSKRKKALLCGLFAINALFTSYCDARMPEHGDHDIASNICQRRQHECWQWAHRVVLRQHKSFPLGFIASRLGYGPHLHCLWPAAEPRHQRYV